MSEAPTIPQQLKGIRKGKGLTLRQVEEISGIKTCYISMIETGRHTPTIPILEKLLSAYNYELKITKKKNGQQKKTAP